MGYFKDHPTNWLRVGKELGEELARRKCRWKVMQPWSRRNGRRRRRRKRTASRGGGGGQI
jgi:hypothetical protein